MVMEGTDQLFDCLDLGGVVVIDFWKDDCLPCARLAPIIDALAEQFPDVRFVKLNVNDAPKTAARFGVTSFPMVYILKEGQRATYFGGWMPQRVVADMILEAAR
jgi:thioredoxin 1